MQNSSCPVTCFVIVAHIYNHILTNLKAMIRGMFYVSFLCYLVAVYKQILEKKN